jgi:hypothetical protein
MFKNRAMVSLAAVTLLSGMWLGAAQAQDGGSQRQRDRSERPARAQQGEGQGRGGEGRGPGAQQGEGRGGENRFAEMRQRMAQRMKEALAVSDEEWAVLEPRIQKVQQLQQQSRIGGMGMGRQGGPGGPGGPGAQGGQGGPRGPQANQNSPVARAAADLRAALEDKGTSSEVIKARVEALRNARVQAQAELAKAQEELKELLEARQEAHLVMLGILE